MQYLEIEQELGQVSRIAVFWVDLSVIR